MKKSFEVVLWVACSPLLLLVFIGISVYGFSYNLYDSVRSQIRMFGYSPQERRELHDKLMASQGCPDVVVARGKVDNNT